MSGGFTKGKTACKLVAASRNVFNLTQESLELFDQSDRCDGVDSESDLVSK